MDAAVTLYEEDCSLRSIADALTLNPIKVRKLLITAGVYESEVAEKVLHKVEGISFCKLTSRDVVRHPLVQKIVQAYDNYEKAQERRSSRKERHDNQRRR